MAGRITRYLDEWAAGRGRAGPELRVFLAPGISLVPDVSFISAKRWATFSSVERIRPPVAPDIVIEVRSPSDREAFIRRKTELYRTYGAIVVLNVDPQDRTVRINSRDGERTLHLGDTFEHSAFPGLRIAVAEMFAPLDEDFAGA